MKLCDLDEMLKTINPFKSLHDQYMYNSIKTIGEMCEIKAIPMGWISAYTRGPLSNKDYWAIIRMVSKWEDEQNEV